MDDAHVPDRDEILAKWGDGTLVDALFAEYGRIWLDEESPTIGLLVDLHNAGDIDLLDIITTEAVGRHKGPDFFGGQHLYERLIPRITGSVRKMVRVVETIRVGAGNDMAAGLHIDKFAKWCGDDPSRPAELLALIDEGFAEATGIILVRQKPGSAKGVLFLTIEDESGIANGIIWPDRFEAQRRTVMSASMIGMRGHLQKEGEVIHVICARIVDYGDLLARVGQMGFRHATGRGDGARHAGSPDRGDPGWRPRDSYWPPHAAGMDPEEVVRVKTRDFR